VRETARNKGRWMLGGRAGERKGGVEREDRKRESARS